MKNISLILLLFILFSCEKIEDHYRIKDVNIQFGNVLRGPNNQCIKLSNKTDSTYQGLIGIRIELIREYYSTENSPSSGIMYSPKGWKGCSEKISKLTISSESRNINDLLYGDTLITGIEKGELTSIRCQEEFGCECQNVLSVENIKSFVSSFNSQQDTESEYFISEQYDETPFIFFVNKNEIQGFNDQSLKIQIEMSNGDIINRESK